MPTKQGPLRQHQLLHQYWPHDCCLCAKEQEIEYLKAQLVIGKEENAELHTALVEQTSAATEATRQLVEAKSKDKRCETCGSLIINHTLICGAPQCCPSCCKIATLEAELAALRLEWRTGKPPIDGWYWMQNPKFNIDARILYLWPNDSWNESGPYQWAGPIQPPAEPKEPPVREE